MSRKFEMILPKDKAAMFLRSLATAIESGTGVVDDYDIQLNGFRKIKVSLANEEDQMVVKLKVKEPKGQGEEDKEKYKKLKKRMKVYFKDIGTSINKGYIPSEDLMTVFLADSEKMISYPGYGDEYYQEYSNLCAQFEEAVKGEDLELVQEKYAALATNKMECHSRYK